MSNQNDAIILITPIVLKHFDPITDPRIERCKNMTYSTSCMHWMLDMTFREDESRIRKKKMAGLDDEYRSTLLESGIKMG